MSIWHFRRLLCFEHKSPPPFKLNLPFWNWSLSEKVMFDSNFLCRVHFFFLPWAPYHICIGIWPSKSLVKSFEQKRLLQWTRDTFLLRDKTLLLLSVSTNKINIYTDCVIVLYKWFKRSKLSRDSRLVIITSSNHDCASHIRYNILLGSTKRF